MKYRIEDDDANYVSSEGPEIKKYYEGKGLRKVKIDELIFCYELTKVYGGPVSNATVRSFRIS